MTGAGPIRRFIGAVCAIGFAALFVAAMPAATYRDLPPPGHTGQFGEPSCDACHFFNEINDPAGSFVIEGVPGQFEPGRVYPLTVVLARRGMAVGGFQIAARFREDGSQAGELLPGEGEAERVGVTESRTIQYIHHELAGTDVIGLDTARWTLLWTAPAKPGAILFAGAANAADGDDSVSGDYIYTATAESLPPED